MQEEETRARDNGGDPSATRAAGARQGICDLSEHELGRRGEDMAAAYLAERRGWEVVDRNWRCGWGEVDIVARQPGEERTAVLVEVKTRLALGEGAREVPELAVDFRKQRRYRSLALAYLLEHPDYDVVRFDVVALNVVGEGQAKLRHLVGAYVLDD